MGTNRRGVLAVAAGLLGAGCRGTGGGGTPSTPTTTRGDGPPRCDPADVTRPPVAEGGALAGREYPPKPSPLTDQSVLEFLDEFETAFAWNRVLRTADATSLNVENRDGFAPDETGDGYLASSGMRVSYTADDGTTSERAYVANYFVSPGPVLRTESTDGPTTPRGGADTQLVQCGPGDAGEYTRRGATPRAAGEPTGWATSPSGGR